MHPDLNQKVAIVTGADRGIGKAIALALGRAHATVIVTARSTTELETIARQIRDQGAQALALPADLRDERDILNLFKQVRDRFGRLDLLINNAGVGKFGPTADFSMDDFDQVIATNLRGLFACCREALKLMLPARSGYIINIASVVGFKGYPRQAAYTASKHGVMGLTKSLAAEVSSQGIRVSAILPGGVDTSMVGDARPDLKRDELLAPEDVAASVLYLLSLSDRAAVDEIYIRRKTSAPF